MQKICQLDFVNEVDSIFLVRLSCHGAVNGWVGDLYAA